MENKAEKKYIEIMQKKTGEERLKIAMDLRNCFKISRMRDKAL